MPHEEGGYDVPPDEPQTEFPIRIEAQRTKVGTPGEPDAVWVCLTSPSYEDLTGPEAKQMALQYVARTYGRADGFDATDGPRADDGRGPLALTGSEFGGGVMTAAQYRQMAAQQNATKKFNSGRYCYFVRVRRNSGV